MNDYQNRLDGLESLDQFDQDKLNKTQHTSIYNDVKHQEVKDNQVDSLEQTQLEEDLKNLDEFDEETLNKDDSNLIIHENRE